MPVNLRRVAWVAAVLVAGAAAGLLLLGRHRAQGLTAEEVAAARRVWEDAAPDAYTLELEMRGALNERRVVVVRQGRVVSMTAGGVEAPESAREYGSVEGLFDTLDAEIANASDPRRRIGGGEVVLLARFDPTWGYPSYFYRHVMGSPNDIEWKVVRFVAE